MYKKAKVTTTVYNFVIVHKGKTVIIALRIIHAPNASVRSPQRRTFDDKQAARILADLNANNVKEQAPINHLENFIT